MHKYAHKIFVLFLFYIGITVTVAIGIRNYDYYILPLEERPFHERYEELKPTGIESHTYGVIGSAMIIFGVALYSSRKRIRKLMYVGKIKHFLEFHIFLCLLGPVLIMYHTTFKFGGLVAVSFWSMTAVVLSGIIGRYLYVQIPKGIHGNELSIQEIDSESDKLLLVLKDEFGVSEIDIKKIDALARTKQNESVSIISLLLFFIIGDITRRARINNIIRHLHDKSVDHRTAGKIARIANERIKLLQRIYFLEQLKSIFHYWHVVHLPFTIIMFIILFIHVGVAIAFGYTWIF